MANAKDLIESVYRKSINAGSHRLRETSSYIGDDAEECSVQAVASIGVANKNVEQLVKYIQATHLDDPSALNDLKRDVAKLKTMLADASNVASKIDYEIGELMGG